MMMGMPRPVILLASNHIAPETFIGRGWRNIYYQQGENFLSRLLQVFALSLLASIFSVSTTNWKKEKLTREKMQQ